MRALCPPASIPFQARANGYDSDTAVWQAMAKDNSLAVIDANSLAANGGFGGTAFVKNIDPRDTSFPPFDVVIYDPDSGSSSRVTIVGIIETGASSTFPGLEVTQATFDSVFARAGLSRLLRKDGQRHKQHRSSPPDRVVSADNRRPGRLA